MPAKDSISPHCSGSTSRREFLQIGALTLGGLSLSEVLAARAQAGETNKDTSVILLYCFGGPSHLETYDLKPDAPSSYRSVFNPISTNVPGIDPHRSLRDFTGRPVPLLSHGEPIRELI